NSSFGISSPLTSATTSGTSSRSGSGAAFSELSVSSPLGSPPLPPSESPHAEAPNNRTATLALNTSFLHIVLACIGATGAATNRGGRRFPAATLITAVMSPPKLLDPTNVADFHVARQASASVPRFRRFLPLRGRLTV